MTRSGWGKGDGWFHLSSGRYREGVKGHHNGSPPSESLLLGGRTFEGEMVLVGEGGRVTILGKDHRNKSTALCHLELTIFPYSKVVLCRVCITACNEEVCSARIGASGCIHCSDCRL